jgi:hypothetical protein
MNETIRPSHYLHLAAAGFALPTGRIEMKPDTYKWPFLPYLSVLRRGHQIIARILGSLSVVYLILSVGADKAYGKPPEPVIASDNTIHEGTLKEIGRSRSVDSTMLLADELGNATFVWFSERGRVVFSARYRVQDDAWGAVEQINNIPELRKSTESFGLTGIVDRGGNVIVAWAQDSAGGRGIYIARYDIASSRWQASVRINGSTSLSSPHANHPKLLADHAGNVIAVWNQELIADRTGSIGSLTATYGQGRQYAIHAARYDNASGTWSAAEELGHHAPYGVGASNHNVVIDHDGNVTVAWYQQNVYRSLFGITIENRIVAVRYSPRQGRWSKQLTLSDCHGDCNPQLAADNRGNVMAIWWDGQLWSAFYDGQTGRWDDGARFPPPCNKEHSGCDGGYSAKLSYSTGSGFTALWSTSDELGGARYLQKEQGWEAISRLTHKELPHPAAKWRLLVPPMLDKKGDIEVFWVEPRSIDTDRSLQSVVIHGSHYATNDGRWREGQSIPLHPRGLHPWNDRPPTVIQEASGDILFTWSNNFTAALPDNSGRGPTRSVSRSIGPLIVAARYRPDQGTWSNLAILDEGAFVSDLRPMDLDTVQLQPLGQYGTLAVWSMRSDGGRILRSRLLRSGR